MHFQTQQKVLFKHCDPAGIVFFPRYAEMVNDTVEAFFCDCVGWPFEAMHPDAGVPTAEISMKFTAPSYHGDHLALAITLNRLGKTSLSLTTRASCGDETRFVAEQVLVCINGDGRPMQWPPAIREKLESLMEEPQ